MDNDMDREITRDSEQISEDLRYTVRDNNPRHRWVSVDRTPRRKILIFVGAGVLLFIVLIAIFSGGGEKITTDDLGPIQARLSQLEQRLARIEGMEKRIVALERHEKERRAAIAETERSGGSFKQTVDESTLKAGRVQERMAPPAAKTPSPSAIAGKPSSVTEGRYHEVQSGDNLYGISQRYGISLEELCRLNNITPDQVIYPGQKLLVAPDKDQ